MKVIRFLAVLLALFVIAAIPSAAAPLVGPCASGGAYDPACDVNHDGSIDIYDIQLTAGHWGQTGTYNIYPAMLPKTGQTTCYNVNGNVIPCAGTGQDGDWQKGVAWPNPRFTDNNNGTVADNLTGLIWLKNANCTNATRTWATALTDVASLNSAGTMNSNTCGDTSNGGIHQTDWRLPNQREMQSLVDYSRNDPALPAGHPFIGVQDYGYWSSTTYVIIPAWAWFVGLHDGNAGAQDKSMLSNTIGYVWPVRGGQ